MRLFQSKTFESQWYESFSELLQLKLLDFSALTPQERYFRTSMFNSAFNGTYTIDQSPKSWYGVFGGAEEVHKVVLEGWKEGLEVYEQFESNIELPALPSVRRARVLGRDGYALIPSRAIQGSLKPWRKFKREDSNQNKSRHGSFSIFIDINLNYNHTGSQQLWRAVAGIKLAEALIKSGRRVRVVAIAKTTRKYKRTYMFAMELKGFTDPFDKMKLVTACGLAGFLRVYEFATNANITAFPIESKEGYGRQGNIQEEDLDQFSLNTNCILIKDIYTESACNYMLENMKQKLSGN